MKTNPKSKDRLIRRRTFLKSALTAGAATLAAPRLLAGLGSAGKVNLACCGIGFRGGDDVKALHATGFANIVALCDTDMGAPHTRASIKLAPKARQFQDFRQMFDQMGKDIDAVCVGTPDFSHFPIAMLAMSLGKPVYCEKPMGQTYRQISLMMAAEKKYNVATQMGNQGHSEANYFQFKAWTEAGIIKNVTKITAFMNGSRRWHGMKVSGYLPEEPIPATLDYETWLATAKVHPYNKGYMNGDWRSWYDFGDGALGDWGAHIFDTAHQFLELGLPTEVEAVMLDGWSPFIFPQASTLAFRFPARGSMPPLELTWYDGQKNRPPNQPDFSIAKEDPSIPPPSKGTLVSKTVMAGKVIYGDDLTFVGKTHGAPLSIVPGPKADEIAAKLPIVPKSTSNHHKNFLLACRGEEKTRSPFSVAGPLCQTMALGIIAQRVNAKFSFDRDTQRITDHKVADGMLDGPTPRPDWEQYYKL